MSALLSDALRAARTLRRSPEFTLTAMAALALGIAASTAVFSVVDTVLLQPLPYPDPDRLVQLMTTSPLGDQAVVSIPRYIVWRQYTTAFRYLAACDINGPAINGLWRRRFGGDPRLVGRTISLEYEPYKVIGVLAPGFTMDPPADIWLPLQADSSTTDQASHVRVAGRPHAGCDVWRCGDSDVPDDRAIFSTVSAGGHAGRPAGTRNRHKGGAWRQTRANHSSVAG